jgi:tetratricopeptide (TPR) repeat protein
MQDVLESLRRPAAERIDRRLGVAICRQAGAAALLIPRITTTRNEVVLEVAGVEPRRDREIFHVRSAAAGKSGIHAALDSLAARVRIALHEEAAAIPSQSRPTAQITTASLAAYRDYDRAEACIDRIEMEPARRHLEAAIGIDSTFGLAHGRLAYVLWWLDDSRGERAHLARAFALIDRIPERQRYHVRAQGAMADRQGLEAARSILLEMERFYPDDKEMLFGIGDYSSHLSDYPTAIAYLEKVVTMDANHPRAVQHLARVYRDLGRAAPFLEWSRRNAVLDSVADAAELLGSAQVLAGDTPAGIATLEHGWRRAPSNQGFVAALASAYSHAGRFAEAIQVLESNSDAPRFMHRQRAGVHVQRGGVEAALRDLATAAAIALQENDPADAAVNEIAAALILMLMKDDAPAALACVARSSTAAAAITYRDAYFSYWPYWGGLFKLHLLNRDLEAATALAQERFGADKWYGPYVTTYLHAAKGECEQAAAAASRILEWGPAAENLELYYFLARCQADQGDAEAAMESLRKMAALDSHLNAGTPVLTKGVLLLSELCERNGDPRQAASLCAKLLDRWAQADRDLPDRRAAEQRLARVAKPAVSPAR